MDRIAAGPVWKEKVAALEVNGAPLGPPSEVDLAVYQMPEGLEVVVWDLADGSRIHASHVVADDYLELSVNYPTRP